MDQVVEELQALGDLGVEHVGRRPVVVEHAGAIAEEPGLDEEVLVRHLVAELGDVAGAVLDGERLGDLAELLPGPALLGIGNPGLVEQVAIVVDHDVVPADGDVVDFPLVRALLEQARRKVREAGIGGHQIVEAEPQAARREGLEGLDGGAVDVGRAAGVELADHLGHIIAPAGRDRVDGDFDGDVRIFLVEAGDRVGDRRKLRIAAESPGASASRSDRIARMRFAVPRRRPAPPTTAKACAVTV